MSAGEAHLDVEIASSLWSLGEQLSSFLHRDLLTICYALQYFLPLGQNSTVAVCAANTTALAFLRNQGAPMPRLLGRTAHDLLRWAERHSISLLPQFIMRRNTVLTNFVLSSQSILGSVWTLKLSGYQQLRRRWPVSPDLFPPSLTHRCFPYFSPFHNSNARGTEVLLKPWDGWQTYGFPPYVLIPAFM